MKLEDVTVRQIKLMRHAIGLRRDRVKRYKYEAFRNYYTTPAPDFLWEILVLKGLATSNDFKNGVGSDPRLYSVTRKGLDLLEIVSFIKITEEE